MKRFFDIVTGIVASTAGALTLIDAFNGSSMLPEIVSSFGLDIGAGVMANMGLITGGLGVLLLYNGFKILRSSKKSAEPTPAPG